MFCTYKFHHVPASWADHCASHPAAYDLLSAWLTLFFSRSLRQSPFCLLFVECMSDGSCMACFELSKLWVELSYELWIMSWELCVELWVVATEIFSDLKSDRNLNNFSCFVACRSVCVHIGIWRTWWMLWSRGTRWVKWVGIIICQNRVVKGNPMGEWMTRFRATRWSDE